MPRMYKYLHLHLKRIIRLRFHKKLSQYFEDAFLEHIHTYNRHIISSEQINMN